MKTYSELFRENKQFRKRRTKRVSTYVFGVAFFYVALMIEAATVGNFIFEKMELHRYAASSNTTEIEIVWDSSATYSVSTGSVTWTTADDNAILASGACVDKAQAIVNILKRRYIPFDRIRVAAYDNHVQVVRQNIDGTITFLDEKNWDVVIGESEFPNGFHTLLDPQDFLDAIAYFKPEISIFNLQSFLNARYEKR